MHADGQVGKSWECLGAAGEPPGSGLGKSLGMTLVALPILRVLCSAAFWLVQCMVSIGRSGHNLVIFIKEGV